MLCEFDHNDKLLEHFGTKTSLIAEISAYFRDPKFVAVTEDGDYECMKYLDKFSAIQEVYMKYNCIFQTEADVERIFSFAGTFSLHNYLCCFFH